MKIFRITNHLERVLGLLKKIEVHPKGIEKMLPKTQVMLFHIKGIEGFKANLLKQEMLSIGGDCAISKKALLSKRNTECLLIGTRKHIKILTEKLQEQNSGLKKIAKILKKELETDEKENIFKANNFTFNLKSKVLIMGVLNLTPDSFSGDGIYKDKNYKKYIPLILKKVEEMIKEGADIIDIGGESTRPGASYIKVSEEIKRVIPALIEIRKRFKKIPISVDTYKPQVAKLSIENGADIINDVTGLRNKEMLKVLSKSKVGIICMHMKGRPKTMQKNPFYKDLIPQIIEFLSRSLERAENFGIERERIVIDPGIGFGKSFEDNFRIIKYLEEFKILKRPILIGASKKSFIGYILNQPPQERLYGTLSVLSICVMNGANILRVHDVKEAKDCVKVANAIRNVWYTYQS